MIARCPAWAKSPEFAKDYLKLLDRFGCEPALREWAGNYARMHSGRCRWDAEFLTSRYDVSECLNIGGAPFLFEYFLKQIVPEARIVTLDLEPSRFPNIQQLLGIRIEPVDIEQVSSEKRSTLGTYRCIVFAEIFEHLRLDLLGTMRSLRDLLTDDGILYLTTPNGLRWAAIRNLIFQGRSGPNPVREWSKLSSLGHVGHIREYTRREVEEVLESCGYVVESFSYRRNAPIPRSLFQHIRARGDDFLAASTPWLGHELVFVARKSRVETSAAAPL